MAEKRWGQGIPKGMGFLKRMIVAARAKGLTVQKSTFVAGWSITLPNGAVYQAKSDSDLVSYVKGY